GEGEHGVFPTGRCAGGAVLRRLPTRITAVAVRATAREDMGQPAGASPSPARGGGCRVAGPRCRSPIPTEGPMTPRVLTDEQTARYHEDGYVLVRGFFDAQEMDLLRRAAREDHELDRRAFARADGEGGKVRLSLWNHPGAGIYGMFARCERVVRS